MADRVLTPREWRPPWGLRLIAAWEVMGGVALAGETLWAVAHGTRLSWEVEFLLESILAIAIAGGVALWRGQPLGFLLSCALQLLQVVQVFTRRLTFALILGPVLETVVPTSGSPAVRAGLRADFTFLVTADRLGFQTGFIVNLVAIGVLLALLRFRRLSGQPWFRPRGDRTRWDRAQLIGAYQIGAGALGMLNSMYAPAYAMGNLLFSMAVLASGAALMRHARWSDGIAVALNTVQIPALLTTNWAFLLRSGLSCIVGVAWGESADLQLRLDVGAVIGAPLAPGIDSFVGINLVALALVIALASYQMDDRSALRGVSGGSASLTPSPDAQDGLQVATNPSECGQPVDPAG